MSLTETGRLLLMSALLVLSGCSWLPDQQGSSAPESIAEAEAAEEARQKNFSEALKSLSEGDTERARALLLEIVEARPDSTGALLNLGIIAEREAQPEIAREYFERVLEVDPANVHALNRSAVLARKAGEFDLARSRYLKAIDERPDYAPSLLNLAILLDIYLRLPGEALPYYRRYGEAAPEPHPRLEDWIFDARNRAGQ